MTMFDKSTFKIDTYETLPNVRQFFEERTEKRSLNDERIKEIERYLADLKPFSRLCRLLKDRFLQCASYRCYVNDEVIVHQHDLPTNFHLILTGTAIVTFMRVIDGHIQTLAHLNRGGTFGEKGLIMESEQIFTVTSKTILECLVLSKEDFHSIYMTNDRQCSKDDLKFLKNNVPFLRGFPIDRLYEFPHAIQHCSFGASEVVARDSRRMKHIYVVKRGSFAVWKRLDPDGRTTKLDKYDLDPMDSGKMTEENDETEPSSVDDEATGDDHTLFSEVQLSGDVDESATSTSTGSTRLHRRSTIADEQRLSLAPHARPINRSEIEKKFPGIADKRDRLPLIDYEQFEIYAPSATGTNLAKRSRSLVAPPITKSKLILPKNMIYVHVKTLNEGQAFGLTDMLFPNQPALTLVSNDCECLLLRKSSFVRIASDQYKQNIRRSEVPYPSDNVFYKSYHTHEVWKRYSENVYRDVYQRISSRRGLMF